MSWIEQLKATDRALFLALNGTHAPWADTVMLWVSEMTFWFPLYAFFLYLIQRRHGWRVFAWALPVIALLILGTDKGSVMLFKETVHRLRPCHEPALQGLVHLVPAGCGGQYGFVSSHASNHFGIAAFMSGMLQGRPRWAGALLLAWAALIAFSRVYLGVHYPGDVLVGGLYGFIIGSIVFRIFRHFAMRPTRP